MQQDYYLLLEVSPDAGLADIRRAYFRMAKIYHPDRQVEEDIDSTEKFLAIQHAYEVLSDPKQREAWDATRRTSFTTVAAPAHSAAPVVEAQIPRPSAPQKMRRKARPSLADERDARMAFMKAESFLERGENQLAARAMRAVVKTIPDNPEYLSLYGYALALCEEKLHDARDMCKKALEIEPCNADYHAYLGFVYLQAGLKSTAMVSFEAALKLNPRHSLASLYSRGNDKKKKKSKGFMGSIRGLFVG